MHYKRWSAHGDPLVKLNLRNEGVETRFWVKVDKTQTCWLWTAALDRDGYGAFDRIKAHQFLVGRPPAGMVWDHLCRVRHCVRPEHLELVTPNENVRRGSQRALKTHCAQGHPWTPENTRQGKRQRRCVLCERARNKARYDADPASAVERVRRYYAANREKRLAYAKKRGHPDRHH